MEVGTVQIPPYAFKVLHLQSASAIIYGVVYGFSIGGERCFFGSLKRISDITNLSRNYVCSVLNDLIKKGYVKKTYNTSKKRLEYRIVPIEEIELQPEQQENQKRRTKQKTAANTAKIITDCETVENASNHITDDENAVKTQENAENGDFELVAVDEKPKIRQPENEVLTPVQMVWQAYKQAYIHRYGIEPLRNAKIFGQIKNFVAMVGEKDAPHIVAYYVSHNRALYIQRGHDIGTLLIHAQVIAKDYYTGYQTTGITAKWAEETETARTAAEQAKILIRQAHFEKQQKTA